MRRYQWYGAPVRAYSWRLRRYQWYGAPVRAYSWRHLANDLMHGLRVALAALAGLTALVVGASSLPI